MAELAEEGQFIQTVYGSLKAGNILCHEEAGTKHYIKIKDLQKVKTGKHGAAKVMIQGKDISSNRTYNLSSPGGVTCQVVEFAKKPFILEDIIDEENGFYMRPNDNSNLGSEIYYFDKMDPEDVKLVKEEFKKNNGNELSMMVVMAKDYISFENIRPNNK